MFDIHELRTEVELQSCESRGTLYLNHLQTKHFPHKYQCNIEKKRKIQEVAATNER